MSGEKINAEFPASPFIRRFAETLDFGMALDVLDVGCCRGRNSLHIAKLGHNVIGLSNELSDLVVAKAYAESTPDIKCSFVAGDARRLMFNTQFDLVLVNEVLHQIPKADAGGVITKLKAITKPGGFHLVSDYLTTNGKGFEPFELLDMYSEKSWEIVEHHEDLPAKHVFGDKEEFTSLATIVAHKLI